MAKVVFKKGNLSALGTSSRDANTLYFAEDQGVLFLGNVRISDVIVPTETPTTSNTLPNRIYLYDNKLYFRGMSSGSETVICLDVGDLGTQITALKTLIGSIPSTAEATTVVGYVDEQVDAAKEELQEDIDAKVASVTAADKSITVAGTTTDPTVKVAIHTASGDEATNALELKANGLYVPTPAAADTYTITKAEDNGDYAAVYKLMKQANGTGTATQVGVDINIPKDMVVQSGSVVTVTEDNKGQNGNPDTAGTYIKLVLQNVTNPLFIDVGSLIEYVTSGSSTGDMIVVAVSADHKVTATITDGTITEEKLDEDVQEKLDQAHTHSNKTLLDTYDQTNANLKDAVDKKHEHTNKAELDKITTGDVDKWDEAAEAAETAIQGIKINTTAVNADEDNVVDISVVSGDANGQIKVAGQNVDVKGLASAAYKTEEYFIGGETTSSKDNDTIKGAKAYADDLLTWQSF